MSIGLGASSTPAELNAQAGNLAIQLRSVMQNTKNFTEWFSNLTLAQVETMFGLSSTDAGTLQTLVSYMSTVTGVYYGTVQQGGSGGTGAIDFDFDNALSVLWGGN